MSLHEFKVASDSGAVSGGAMDRVVKRRQFDKRLVAAVALGAVLLIVLLFWLFAPRANSQSVSQARLSIVQVQQGTFEDFLPLRSRVTPLVTVYLDAVE